MIISRQNSNLNYSVDLSPINLVQVQVRKTVSGVFLAPMDIPFQVWHMVEGMQRDFNEHHMTQKCIKENQLGTMQKVEQVSEHVGINYSEFPVSRFVAQPVDDFLFPWEEAGSAKNPITIDVDEGFSETMTPRAPQQSLQIQRILLQVTKTSFWQHFQQALLNAT